MSEKAVHIADKLYETRRTAKFILGPRYEEFATGMASLIRDIIAQSPRKELTPLIVATDMAKAPGINPIQTILVLAAAVDMTEGVI